MGDAAEMLEFRIPDAVSTHDLPARLAAEIDFLAGRVDRWTEPDDRCSPAIAARGLALLGRRAEALAALSRVDPDTAPITDLAAAAWAASRVGGPSVPAVLARLQADAPAFLIGEVPAGPRAMYVGLLHAACGDLPRAIAELQAGAAEGDARAPLWGALCRLELGRVLRTAEAVPIVGAPSSIPVLAAARTFFGAGGYRSLLGRVGEASAPVRASIEIGPPSCAGFGVQPTWAIRPSKGLLALVHLVANGHRVVSAIELAQVVDGGGARDVAAITAATWRVGQDDVASGAGATTEAIREVLFDDATRSRITKLLRRTIVKLADSQPLIAAHLAASIVTGHGCGYRPAGSDVAWTLDRGR